MKKTIGKDTKGTMHRVSANTTRRTGRSDGFEKNQPQRGVKTVEGAATPPEKAVREVPGDNRSYGKSARSPVPVQRLENDGVAGA